MSNYVRNWSYLKFLRLTKFKTMIPNKRNVNVTNRIGGSLLPFLTTMGIFDIGWIELFQVDNCPWNEMIKFQRVDGKWNIKLLVKLEMTYRSKKNCSFMRIVWPVNEYHPIIRTWLSNRFRLLDEFLNYESEDLFWKGEALSTKTTSSIELLEGPSAMLDALATLDIQGTNFSRCSKSRNK